MLRAQSQHGLVERAQLGEVELERGVPGALERGRVEQLGQRRVSAELLRRAHVEQGDIGRRVLAATGAAQQRAVHSCAVAGAQPEALGQVERPRLVIGGAAADAAVQLQAGGHERRHRRVARRQRRVADRRQLAKVAAEQYADATEIDVVELGVRLLEPPRDPV